MSGWRHGPRGMLMAAAAAVAVVTGATLGQRIPLARSDAGPGLLASVAADFAEIPEVYSATEADDVLPAEMTDAGPVPVPAQAPVATAAQPLFTRVPKPMLAGPRRIGIQAGHWQTGGAPPELWRLLTQTGTSWNGTNEVTVNLDIAQRVKAILDPKGILVDVLPTTIPPGYVADAFVALHADGDGTGENSGFKMAFSARRTPYESDLLESIKGEYAKATGLGYDGGRISRAMINYYLFGWQRNKWSTAPHTPSVILEMGYLSNDADRELMTGRPDVIAAAIASGLVRFLDDHPRERLFGQDLLVPAIPQVAPPARPSPSPAG